MAESLKRLAREVFPGPNRVLLVSKCHAGRVSASAALPVSVTTSPLAWARSLRAPFQLSTLSSRESRIRSS